MVPLRHGRATESVAAKTPKADLDKLYKHSTEQTATTFPQGTTGTTFAENARKSAETFELKYELLATRKRKLKHERAEATEARAVARQGKSKAAQLALDKVVSDRAHFQCIDCDRRFAREASMDGHACEVSEQTRSTIQQPESSEANKKPPFEAPTTVPVSPTTSSRQRRLLMGHGLHMGRSVTVLDDAVKRIPKIQFQLGVTKSSNRKGVFEMMEERAKTIDSLQIGRERKVVGDPASYLEEAGGRLCLLYADRSASERIVCFTFALGSFGQRADCLLYLYPKGGSSSSLLVYPRADVSGGIFS
jgi:hypothetical protein